MWPETKASAVHRHQVLCGISSLSTAVGDLFSLRLHVNKQKGTVLQLPSCGSSWVCVCFSFNVFGEFSDALKTVL